MSDFERLKEQGRIEEVTRDNAKARGLLKRSGKRLENQQKRDITDDTAFEILENVYESLREAIEAGMAVEGFKSEDHVSTLAYADEKLGLSESQVNKLHRFRKLRNESRYEAREIRKEEAEQLIELARELLPEIRTEVEKRLEN